MNNFLSNGAVLPSGLIGISSKLLDGFKKTYQNCYLRVGLIKDTYEIADEKNINKLVPEYDVLVFEQNEDKGSTIITYKNCTRASSFGSIADFFEVKLRKMKSKKTKGVTPSPSGQNGAIVLLLCLNGFSDKGIIVNELSHPDRKTTLSGDELHLEGEYNGVNVKIEKDGSCSLTFKGATDNDGKITDSSQGPTSMQIEKDGSYQISLKDTTVRFDKSGKTSLKTKSDVSVISDEGDVKVTATKGKVQIVSDSDIELTSNSGKMNITSKGDLSISVKQGDATIDIAQGSATVNAKQNIKATAQQNVEVTAQQNATVQCQGTATVEGVSVKLGKAASQAVIRGTAFAALYDNHVHPKGPPLQVNTGPPVAPMDATLSTKVLTE